MTVQRMLPLYEGKMGNQFDHRSASFHGVGDTDISPNREHDLGSRVLPRYWVREGVFHDQYARRAWGTDVFMLGFRRVARNTDERTAIATALPVGPASYGWILSAGPKMEELSWLLAEYNSFAFDYILRQFLSQPSIPQGTFAQLPTVGPGASLDWTTSGVDWVVARSLELSCTSDDLGQNDEGVPLYEWDVERRFWLRAELDAAFFHLYGVEREDVDYIMETFPIVKRKDVAAHGEYRTKRAILEIYDAMQRAIDSGTEYQSVLDPPPGQGPRHEGED